MGATVKCNHLEAVLWFKEIQVLLFETFSGKEFIYILLKYNVTSESPVLILLIKQNYVVKVSLRKHDYLA